jgi:pyruvate/2-oxoglutarate dehydrogenase complex dihydrolipoamide acyltransferase (E2) component
MTEVDLTQVDALRRQAGDAAASYTAYVAKAVALALRDFPYANRRVCRPPSRLWLAVRLAAFHRCDVAIGAERDLPGAESVAFFDVFRDVDRMPVAEINEALRALAASDMATNAQWRSFSSMITRLPAWLSTLLIRLPYLFPRLWIKYRGAAVLITSPAKYGVDAVVASTVYPLSVSFGLAKARAVVRDGQLVARRTFMLTLGFDRRVMAGAQAARFYRRIVENLERAVVGVNAEGGPTTESGGATDPQARASSG